MTSIREKILTTPPRREPVDLPAVGCTVYAQAMTARELVAYRAASTALADAAKAEGNPPDGTLSACLLVVHSIRDEAGAPVFTDADARALADADGATVNRLADVAAKVNGIGEADAAAEKKSPAASGGSGSGSPGTSATPTPTTSSTT